MGPDLGEELEVDGVDCLGVLFEEMVNGEIIGRRLGGIGSGLATGAGGQEKGDRGNEEASARRVCTV